MAKQICSLIVCLALLISVVPISVNAEEYTFYQIMIDAGNGAQGEKAIVEDGEIYIAASSFEKYTRYVYHRESHMFLIKGQEANKAFKKVIVNAESKKIAVGTKLVELSDSFVIDGEVYLPLCQMLPILNADIIEIASGIIYVINNELSMAELLYGFDINDYWFNISEEFFGRTDLLYWYVGPSYLFDTVVNFRFDRLDIIFDSGKSQDYQTILTGYLKDDELFHKAKAEKDAAGDLLESITGLTGISGTFNDVYDWAEKISKLEIEEGLEEYFEFDKLELFIKKGYADGAFEDELKEILGVVHDDMISNDIIQDAIPGGLSFADSLEAVDYLYSLLTQVDDHRKMLDAVYNVTGSGETSEMASGTSSPWFAYNVEGAAAAQVYELYSGDIVPAYTKKMTEEVVKRLFEDRTLYNAYGVYKLTAGLAGEILELYLPGESGDRALLPQHADIANSAMRKAAVPTLDTEVSTEQYRLSLLLTLLASRACYDIMAETAEGYGQDAGYYLRKVAEIENMIMGLYLVAGNVAFDTYENYEEFAEQNKQVLEKAALFDNIKPYPEVDEADYLEFLRDYPEYNYHAFLDINGDGVIEMLATDGVQADYTSAYNQVDLFVWKDGIITLAYDDLWSKYENLSYDSTNRWLQCGTGGTGASGVLFVYLDDNMNSKEISIDYYWNHDSETTTVFFNGVDVTNTVNESYEKTVKTWDLGTPEDVVFKPIMKSAPGEESDYCHSYRMGTSVFYDLDGDNVFERITVTERDYQAELTIDGITYELDAFWANPVEYYTILNVNDAENVLLIGISDYGTSDDSVTFLYTYDQGRIHYVGSFDDLIGQPELSAKCNGDGTISANTRMNDVGTWIAKATYAVDNHTITDITDFYRFADFYGYDKGREVTTKCDLPMYDDLSLDAVESIIPAGTTVIMLGCRRLNESTTWIAFESAVFDNTKWILVNTGYWPRYIITPYGGIESSEAFDGFYYAG